MSTSVPHIAYLFTSNREKLVDAVRAGEDADTALRGLNHIPGAVYYTVPVSSLQAFCIIPRLLQYDFVIAQDNFLLGYLVSKLAKVFRLKTRWLFLSMHSSTLLRRHSAHPVRLFLFKIFWSNYAHIICLSTEQIEELARFGIPRTRLTYIPLGVDTHFFRPTDVSSDEDLIVSVGRDAGRDYATLLRAASHSSRRCIIVAGRGNIPSALSVPSNVSILYNRPANEVRELYRRAKVVVVVSKDENVPEGSDCSGQTVVLDALAAGRAVIATDRSWIGDYFVPGEDLVVVPPSDPEALGRAIDTLFRDGAQREHIATSGHAKVTVHYTTKVFARSLCKLMSSI